jgi:2-polyprenyl-6-methoxyphenol hydroxylase-like FAD-dependent oxidoreductase
VTVFFSPDGFVLAAPLPDDHFRVIAPMTNAPEALSREYFQAIVDARGPGRGDSRIRQVVWASRFHIQHRIAATLCMGRALLCGDAAHVHSPAGGQGMNTGIQDAVALAEPLARTLRTGDAAELQQWAEKRRQIAENVISMTDRMTTVITATNHALRFVRNAALSFVGHLPGASNLIARKLAELDNR